MHRHMVKQQHGQSLLFPLHVSCIYLFYSAFILRRRIINVDTLLVSRYLPTLPYLFLPLCFYIPPPGLSFLSHTLFIIVKSMQKQRPISYWLVIFRCLGYGGAHERMLHRQAYAVWECSMTTAADSNGAKFAQWGGPRNSFRRCWLKMN